MFQLILYLLLLGLALAVFVYIILPIGSLVAFLFICAGIVIGTFYALKSYIEAAFSEVHYFPVSAMGHAANGEAFEPEHVLEPFHWLIGRANAELADGMGIARTKTVTSNNA